MTELVNCNENVQVEVHVKVIFEKCGSEKDIEELSFVTLKN